MVRGLAALLVATAYVLGAGALPSAGAYAPAVAGAIAIGLCAMAPLAGRDDPVAVAVLGAGAVVLAVALNAQDVVSEVTPVEALFAACAGLLFAFGFAVPAAVVALPIVVAGIDAASLLAGAEPIAERAGSDMLTLALPAWGDDPAGSIPAPGLLTATFLALFAAWALRYDLRPRVAIVAMVAGLAVAQVLSLALDRSIPALPLLALGFLAPSIRRIGHVLRSEG